MWEPSDTIRIRFYFDDATCNTAETGIHLPISVGMPAAADFVIEFASLLQALSDALLRGITLSLPFTRSQPPPIVGSAVDRAGTFIWRTSLGGLYETSVPSIVSSLLIDGLMIDQTQSAVATFVDMMIVGDGTIAPISITGDIASLETAYYQLRPGLYPRRRIG